MITEDYVSFETAKLLKEKGFDVYVSSFYDDEGTFSRKEADWNWNIGPRYSAPTLQMAMKWLREVHRIFIRIIQSHIDYCCFEVYWNRGDYYKPMTFCNSYEEACEAAIKYCLENLI